MLKSSWKMSWKYFSYFKLAREWHNPCSSVSQGSIGTPYFNHHNIQYHCHHHVVVTMRPDQMLGPGVLATLLTLAITEAFNFHQQQEDKNIYVKNRQVKRETSRLILCKFDIVLYPLFLVLLSSFPWCCVVFSVVSALAYLNFPVFCFSFLLSVSHLKISRFA